MLKDNNVICFGAADWDNPFMTNQHHIMKRLSRYNRILFIESLGLRRPVAQGKDLKRMLRRLLKGLKGIKKTDENLFVLSPLVIPFHKFRFIRGFNNLLLKLYLGYFINKHNFNENIIWSYIPNAVDFKAFLGPELMVYHCVDELAANPLIPDELRTIEKRMLEEANIVFVTSRSLLEAKRKFARNIVYSPNVADFKHFSRAAEDIPVPEDIFRIRKPVAGFIGAVSGYKLDFKLISYTARNLPEVSFVLIGPLGEGEKRINKSIELFQMENVHYLGPRPYEKLPGYIRYFDVCMMPGRINEYTRNMFPMKFFEYMASGKPIVTTELAALKEFSSYFYISRSPEEFSRSVKTALNEDDPEIREQRIALASGYGWEKRLEFMSEKIEDARKQAL